MNARTSVVVGGILAALGVAAGAFGAHALKETLSPVLSQTFNTAARYHLIHAVGMVCAGVVANAWPSRCHRLAAVSFFLGVVLFSGSLYALALSGVRLLGVITPFGGFFFIAGWSLLVIGVIQSGKNDERKT